MLQIIVASFDAVIRYESGNDATNTRAPRYET